ncbi:hypothetical protein R8Z57_07730 [Microbacterium sp. M3]|uniref:DUF2399 domain-containing protein n=1 Tax=Microbacterium arthrosphaerae TaxID=792652 RepID=A0ABU4H032_9MICO|nr:MULTISPECIES: hypothetical protein [Microbacterium]MDW4572665.1 hypothetical protein [Microbacterium arthrosphaerae]MDW7606520.1 hypothetical protein [Microbacterium sp. M3]
MTPEFERLEDGRVRVPWADPSDHIRAVVPLVRRDGELRAPSDRRGRLKSDRLRFVAAEPMARAIENVPITEADWAWVLGASRRAWATVLGRWADAETARLVSHSLVEAGVVELDVRMNRPGRVEYEPVAWLLTPTWEQARRDRNNDRAVDRESLRTHARTLAERVGALDPGMAAALGDPATHEASLAVLVAAADDLLDGVTHDGPRAFSQVHFGHTKAREDAPSILRAAGVCEATIGTLGLARSPYIGLGGALVVSGIDLSKFAGPVRLRASGVDGWGVTLPGDARAVVLVENLQAAEAVCDIYPDIAVVWFAGQPADAVLRVCTEVARRAARADLPILIAPDADLGGVYIARLITAVMPAEANVVVVDAGAVAPATMRPFSKRTLNALAELSVESLPLVAAFAQAVRERGRPVEQEAAIRQAIREALRAA